MRTYLVTGAAGFIGYHVASELLERGHHVVGLDNLSPYYDVRLKHARLDRLRACREFSFEHLDLVDSAGVTALFGRAGIDRVIHLAAQAGVRYSLTDPHAYVASNVTGTLNVLEGCRHHPVEHLVLASTSSVYGLNARMPFTPHDPVDHPITLYAATKKGTEAMAHAYAHLFGIPSTVLRFFTVYGPWGRPDMALFRFTKAILAGEPIDVYNHGLMHRDFTYVDDVVDGVLRACDHPPAANAEWDRIAADSATSSAPWQVFNIGNRSPVPLLHLIEVLEQAFGRTAERRLLPMQPGDVPFTYADVSALSRLTGFDPKTPVEVGVPRFVEWYREFYGV